MIHSEYFQSIFGTAPMRAVFSDRRRIDSWLDSESALANAQARVGLIPTEAAFRIMSAARLESADLAAMKAEYDRVGFPVLPLVHQLAKACDPESARWIHWGATTQDIIDTGLALQMKQGLELLEKQLADVIQDLVGLTRTHRNTVMPGRTFQQQAAPITFGFKTAIWLDELLRHRERLGQVRQRALVVQFGGAVGTLATLGDQGTAVVRELAKELGLGVPPISWHTARDGWADVVFWLALVATTLGKIASEIAMLMRTEVNEVREPYQPGRGGSSTMPQKRNPIACPPMIAIAHRVRDLVPSQLTAMIQEHERAVATQPLEWLVIPEAFILTSGSLKHAHSSLADLEVDADRMKQNLNLDGGLLMAESVMMGLAPKIGRGQAHEIVSAAANRAIDEKCSLRTALLDDAKIMELVSVEEIDRLLDPGNYLGSAQAMIDAVLERAG